MVLPLYDRRVTSSQLPTFLRHVAPISSSMLDAFVHTVCGPNCLATTQQSMPGNDDNLHNASPNTLYTTVVPSLPPPPHSTAQRTLPSLHIPRHARELFERVDLARGALQSSDRPRYELFRRQHPRRGRPHHTGRPGLSMNYIARMWRTVKVDRFGITDGAEVDRVNAVGLCGNDLHS